MNKFFTLLLLHAALLSHLFTYGELHKVQNCEGDFTLMSQAEVDAFTYTEVTSRLVISGSDITNLDALSSLRKVHGDFLIQETKLTALDGLSALDSVGGPLDISSPGLSNIKALASLRTVGDLSIIENNSLTSLDGCSSFTEIKRRLINSIKPNLH